MSNGVSGGVYGMAFLGSLVYYIRHAATFGAAALGVLKSLVWPAVIMYKVLGLLKM